MTAGDVPEDGAGVVVRSPYRPLTRAARRALAEYGIHRDVEAGADGRGGGVVVAERPPGSVLEQHELEIDEPPDMVWAADGGEEIAVYRAAGRVEVDGRAVGMDVEAAVARCRSEARFERVDDPT